MINNINKHRKLEINNTNSIPRRRIERDDIPTNYLQIKEIFSEGHFAGVQKEHIVGKYGNKLIKRNSLRYNIIKIGDYTFNTRLENNLIYDTAFDRSTRLCLFVKDGNEAGNIYNNIKYIPTHNTFYFDPLAEKYYINPLKGSIEHAINTMKIIIDINDIFDGTFFSYINEEVLKHSITALKTIEFNHGNYYTIDDVLKLITDKKYSLELLKEFDDIIDSSTIEFFDKYWSEDKQLLENEQISNKLTELLNNEIFNKIFNYNLEENSKIELRELNILDAYGTTTADCNIIIATRQNVIGDIGDIIGKVLYNDIQTSVLSTKKDDRFDTLIFNDNWKYFNSYSNVLLQQSKSYRAMTYWHLNDIDEIIYGNMHNIEYKKLKEFITMSMATKIIQESDLTKLESLDSKYIPGKNDNVYIY